MTGWLIAWLWQGLALVLAMSAVLKVSPRINAATRYALWWGVLLVLVWLGWSSAPSGPTPPVAETIQGIAGELPPSLIEIPALSDSAIAVIFIVWLSVSLFKLLRVLTGLNALYRLKDACGPVLESIESRLPLWRELQQSGRPVRLMLCNDLPNAAVLGLQDPFVAIPPRLLRLVSPGELDQILLHEYGHVQRRDDWTRLVQALLEAAIWIHPATYLIGRQLNLEREVACDDWVVAKTQAAREYAACLARVTEARQSRAESSLVPALFGRTPDVLRRVDRLLNSGRNATREVSLAAAIAGAAIAVAFAVQLRAVPLVGELSAVLGVPKLPAIATVTLRDAVEPRLPANATEPNAAISNSSSARQTKMQQVDARQDFPVMTTAVQSPVSGLPAIDDRPIASIPNRPINPRSLDHHLALDHAPRANDQGPGLKDQGASGFTRIGHVTKKASVALAGSLTKASVSVANSFQP